MTHEPDRRALRIDAMLRVLEQGVDAAKRHERAMQHGLRKSHTWPDADREWMEKTAAEATADVELAEAALATAHELVAEANATTHGVEPASARPQAP